MHKPPLILVRTHKGIPISLHKLIHTQPHTHTCVLPLARHAHLCGPELQHQSPRLHLLRHTRLLQVQQVTLQPGAPVGPGGQPSWGQQPPQATFDFAHVVLVPCRDRAQGVGVTDPPPARGHPALTSHEAKGLLGGTPWGWGVPVGKWLQGSPLNVDVLFISPAANRSKGPCLFDSPLCPQHLAHGDSINMC